MASAVEICNLALSQIIGTKLIQALTDNSTEARLCKALFNISRDAILASNDWPFARRQASLVLLNETRTGWTFCYQQPADCCTTREIFNPNAPNVVQTDPRVDPTIGIQTATQFKIPMEKGLSVTGNFSVIFTNQASAELIYTGFISNEAVFPPKFAYALAMMLASELAVPLRGDYQIAQAFSQKAVAAVTSAEARADNEETQSPSTFSNLSNARL